MVGLRCDRSVGSDVMVGWVVQPYRVQNKGLPRAGQYSRNMHEKGARIRIQLIFHFKSHNISSLKY